MVTPALKDSDAKYQSILMQALFFNLKFECEILLFDVAKQNDRSLSNVRHLRGFYH
jgi:hypothetical protein